MTDGTMASTQAGLLPHLAVARATSFLKLLAHEGRLQIMCVLVDESKTVSEIAASLGLAQPAVSQHLMRLRAEGLVVAHRDGRSIRYVLGHPETVAIIRALQTSFCPVDDTNTRV